MSTATVATSALNRFTSPVFGADAIASTNGYGPADEAYWLNVRADFPITRELIYMNNGTMGPSPKPVTDRVISRVQHVDSTGDYSGNYDAIRAAIARVLGAPGAETIAFTHNTSEAISIVSSGMELNAGYEVIMTDQEHAGNAIPWLARKKRDGIVVKYVTLAPDDEEVMKRFEQAITPRTRVIAVPHVTCTTGQVLPLRRLADLARAHNIWLMADGAHPPGMMQVDVQKLGVHAYASCGHKWLCGPKGIGFLYIAPELMDRVIPTWSGAEADKYWDYNGVLDFLPTASRYDFATQNFALFDGLLAAIEYMEKIGFATIQSRLEHLSTLLRNGLAEFAPGRFTFLTPPTSLTGITTIKLASKPYQEFANELLSKYKVRTRVVPESKLDANRFSVHIYTSEDDVNRFLHGVRAVLNV